MKLLPFALESVIVQPIWDMDSLGELASGVELRPLINFHMSFPLVLVMAPSRSSLQLSVLTLLMTFFFLFSACFNPLLLVSFDGMLQSIACSYLSLYVRCHPWFGFSTRFCFP